MFFLYDSFKAKQIFLNLNLTMLSRGSSHGMEVLLDLCETGNAVVNTYTKTSSPPFSVLIGPIGFCLL